MKRIVIVLSALLFMIGKVEAQPSPYIGMPIGGICAGQVYLGGDGQLWYWDVFNIKTINPGGGGDKFYVKPLVPEKRFEQGFALKVRQGNKQWVRKLNNEGFKKISFTGQYPIGKVNYSEKKLPVTVDLEAYSPFIPTDAENSGLPLIVLEYTVKNTSSREVEVDLSGWLQNTACLFSKPETDGFHVNTLKNDPGFVRLTCSAKGKKTYNCPDLGNMSLTLLGEGTGNARIDESQLETSSFSMGSASEAQKELGESLVGSLTGSATLKRGEARTFRFLLSWYFPNVHLWNAAPAWLNKGNLRHYYSKKFKSSEEVADFVGNNPQLLSDTKSWVKSWYDSSLPKWFLDRTFANVSTLATTVCVRFDDLQDIPFNEGRFYTYEGVYLGDGTCTHVFHYEQAMGRVFPTLTRNLRQQVDLGLSYKENGTIGYRGEFSWQGHHFGTQHAIDGHAGTVLRCYREHTMSPDYTFLHMNWPKLKKAIQLMIDQDKEKSGEADGILEGPQYNTLDRTWYGKIAWISGLYAASLKAGAAMASEMGDTDFANQCAIIAERAYKNIGKELFNGEYFIQKTDPQHPEAPNSNQGCHSDQLLGQYWASQIGVDPIVPNDQIKTALNSIFKYNFIDNYGRYLDEAVIPVKRYYADKDEKGLIMCTFPKGGADKAPGIIKNEWEKLVVGYFSEIWTGQEHQVAATMIAEGMVDEAMAIEKALHERYDAAKRNPYNEVEYGNHYTRAMSGYAPFVAASGFTYHGPKGIIGFDPKIKPEDFKSAFISAQGWGQFTQKRDRKEQINTLLVNYGKLSMNQFGITLAQGATPKEVTVFLNNKPVSATFENVDNRVRIQLDSLQLKVGDKLEARIKTQ